MQKTLTSPYQRVLTDKVRMGAIVWRDVGLQERLLQSSKTKKPPRWGNTVAGECHNRRFWPVRAGTVQLDQLRNDIDQLWAEAVVREAAGEPIVLSEHLWEAAAELTDLRLMEDAFAGVLDDWLATKKGRISMDSVKLLLGFEGGRLGIHSASGHRICDINRRSFLSLNLPVATTPANGRKGPKADLR